MRASIAVLPGDGVGPEVTAEAVRVLRAIGESFGHDFMLPEALIGGAAIDSTGQALPEQTKALVQQADAVLLGAVGGPKWNNPNALMRPEQGLLELRVLLATYANLRPVNAHRALTSLSPLRPERIRDVDLIFVRELTGGLYFGHKTRQLTAGGEWQHASDLCEYTATEVARVARMAGGLAQQRRGRVTSVDKANVLETSRLWRSVTTQVMHDEFPDIKLDHALVDAFAMQVLQSPANYDVIVTENLFGDILTDEASVIAGSIGLLPSASLGAPGKDGRVRGIYEPIHGSAPDIAGQGKANPAGAILSAALLLRHSLGLERAASDLEAAVFGALRSGARTPDCALIGDTPVTTQEFGDAVLKRLT